MAVDLIFSGDRVKAVRLRLGLNQTQFAELLGVRTASVSRWEAGKRPVSPSPQILQRLLEAEREAQEKGGA